jgi:hypothetical protein
MAKQKELPLVYWDAGGSGYWLQLNGEFRCMDKTECGEHLIDAGLEDFDEKIRGIKILNRAFLVARAERACAYAGPIAGMRRGMHTLGSGLRVLVTSEPRNVFDKPEPRKHPPARLTRFMTDLFGVTQLEWVFAWLKFARASLVAGDYRPAPILVLAGPSGCGKSFFQDLITEFLGGRSAWPYRYMTGKSSFNADLASAEHLVIADQHASTNTSARRAFGTSIKELTVNADMSVHAKGRQAVTLRTFRRLSLSVNNETENLMIVPPMDDSLKDKMMLVKCEPAELSADRHENWKLSEELPALSSWLWNWKVPDYLAPKDAPETKRYGFKAQHNEELRDVLESVAPETRLLEFIDTVIPDKEFPLRVTADELERELRGSKLAPQVNNLLGSWTSACGTYLARLAAKRPERVEGRKNKGRTIWIIRAP